MDNPCRETGNIRVHKTKTNEAKTKNTT